MTDLDIRPQLGDTDNEAGNVAHIVDQHIPGNSIGDAIVFGTEIVALCGYRWIPTRDPQKFPVCEACRLALEATT